MTRLMSIAAALALVGFAQAQPAGTTQTQTTQSTTTQTSQIVRTTTIVGSNVMLANESLGKVTDIVLSDSGCVEYFVVSYNNQYIPVPFSVVRLSDHSVVITAQNITRQNLTRLAFTGNSYPSFRDQSFVQNMQQVYGQTAIRSGQSSSSLNTNQSSQGQSGTQNSTQGQGQSPTTQPNRNQNPNQNTNPGAGTQTNPGQIQPPTLTRPGSNTQQPQPRNPNDPSQPKR